MTDREVFMKYIKGLRCTREEYLIVQEYLKTASEEVKVLYENSLEFITKSLINNRAKSNRHFLAVANKHGLTEYEALMLIADYASKNFTTKKSCMKR